ncbi:hypothetical protein AVEN_73857-1 [Araneus ventricosus]|uniref:Uncharacterized protein n=1 Tax=Araneus ventricosus TaxID=182803 RepID=A0A4Y2GDH4_ARAVE|nr:hypothetical protein AVEN_73857-1 [Araneus ventricosus]
MAKFDASSLKRTCSKFAVTTSATHPDSNFSLQQICSRLALQVCKLSANLSRQVCKCETSLQQVNASLEVTIGRTCSKLALQIIAKTEYEHNPG